MHRAHERKPSREELPSCFFCALYDRMDAEDDRVSAESPLWWTFFRQKLAMWTDSVWTGQNA